MIQLVTFARVIVLHTGDQSINPRERESVEREEEKSPGTKKEGKLSWNIIGLYCTALVLAFNFNCRAVNNKC